MTGPSAADLADLELGTGVFYRACHRILAGESPDVVRQEYQLTEGQLAYVRRFAGEPRPLFPSAEQLALPVDGGGG